MTGFVHWLKQPLANDPFHAPIWFYLVLVIEAWVAADLVIRFRRGRKQ